MMSLFGDIDFACLVLHSSARCHLNQPMETVLNLIARRFTLAALLSISFCAQALDNPSAPVTRSAATNATPPGMHFMLNLGVTFGGDTIATATYVDGSSKNVNAGELLQLGVGGIYQLQDTPLALMLSGNYHISRASASNGGIKFSRIPVEALAFYTGVERFRFGGGLRMINSPEATIEINGSSRKYTYENAMGYVAEVGYRLPPSSWINFRYVSEKYQGTTYTAFNGTTTSLAGTSPVDGSHFGINLTFEF
jgi:hypothetical protein